MQSYIYNEDDLARICEVAVILNEYGTNCEDLHDFYLNHVKPAYEAWLRKNGEGVYKCLNEDEEAYISEFANRVAQKLYKKRNL